MKWLLAGPLVAFEVGLGLVALVEQTFAGLYRLVYGLGEILALFILAKELLADKEHSNAEAVAFYVFVVAVARADFFAILNGVAAQGHSRAVPVTVIYLVFSQALLNYLDNFRLGKEFVGSALNVFLGKGLGAFQCLVNVQLALQRGPPEKCRNAYWYWILNIITHPAAFCRASRRTCWRTSAA